MTRGRTGSGSYAGVLCIALVGIVIGGITASANAADRVVLAEEFTATWCSNCPYAGEAMGMLMDENPNDLAVIQVHRYDSYSTTFGDSRMLFYSVSGVPDAWFDGVDRHTGATSVPEVYQIYSDFIQARQQVASPLYAWVGAVETAANTYEVSFKVTHDADLGTAPVDARLYIALVRDHYPSGAHYRNCVINGSTAVDVTLQAGESYTMVDTFTFSAAWPLANMKFIAWAQPQVGGGPAEAYQAAILNPPFRPLPELGDGNYDGHVDVDDYLLFQACLAGPGNPAPSFECLLQFDFDGDDAIGMSDFADFQAAFTGPAS